MVCEKATSKPLKCYTKNSGHCFANYMIKFLCCLQFCFCLAAFFIFDTTDWTQSVIQCIPPLSTHDHMCLYYWVYPISKSLLYSLFAQKTIREFDPCGWPQMCCFVIINMHCIYVKMQKCISKDIQAHFHSLRI